MAQSGTNAHDTFTSRSPCSNAIGQPSRFLPVRPRSTSAVFFYFSFGTLQLDFRNSSGISDEVQSQKRHHRDQISCKPLSVPGDRGRQPLWGRKASQAKGHRYLPRARHRTGCLLPPSFLHEQTFIKHLFMFCGRDVEEPRETLLWPSRTMSIYEEANIKEQHSRSRSAQRGNAHHREGSQEAQPSWSGAGAAGKASRGGVTSPETCRMSRK